MPPRLVPLVVGEVYHVLNRGNNKQNIFVRLRDYKRFTQTIAYYQYAGKKPKFSNFNENGLATFKPDLNRKLVDIICYCLMPNHVHLLVRQRETDGVSNFMRQAFDSYAKYFNTKHARTGSPFEGRFKAVLVSNDEYLLHVSRYIHLNPVVSGLVKNLEDYSWSSYHQFMGTKEIFCTINTILDMFKSRTEYRQFLEDRIEYGTSLELVKHQVLDGDS